VLLRQLQTRRLEETDEKRAFGRLERTGCWPAGKPPALYLEDSQQGGALLRFDESLEVPSAMACANRRAAGADQRLCHGWPALAPPVQTRWHWAALELAGESDWRGNQKLIPLGQTMRSVCWTRLLPALPPDCRQARAWPTKETGCWAAGLAFASARNEQAIHKIVSTWDLMNMPRSNTMSSNQPCCRHRGPVGSGKTALGPHTLRAPVIRHYDLGRDHQRYLYPRRPATSCCAMTLAAIGSWALKPGGFCPHTGFVRMPQ